MADRPTLRILHQAARTGGTIISRALGAMKGVVILSEIHPLGLDVYHPARQASDWFGLVSDDEARQWQSSSRPLPAVLADIAARCEERALTPIVRDWSHLDFHGVPFNEPTGRSLLVEALAPSFEVKRFSTVRHPLDQWLSMNRQEVLRGRMTPVQFLEGADAFARQAVETGFVRFEDFTQDPDRALGAICDGLGLDYDAGWSDAWHDNVQVTGDVHPGRAGDRIRPLPRQAIDPRYESRFLSEPLCRQILERLGYPDESAAKL